MVLPALIGVFAGLATADVELEMVGTVRGCGSGQVDDISR